MQDLLDKIKKIEALIAGATSEGEKQAALSAKDRIMGKYPSLDAQQNAVEYALHSPDRWHKDLIMALCRKYGLRPYRYYREKYTTVMVRVNKDFLNNVLWKEYLEYSRMLEALVDDVAGGLIDKIHQREEEDIIHGELKG